jgi:dicarboxylate transporter 10
MSKTSYPFYFGGAASCVAAVVVHPFDLTKVRLQNTKGGNHGMFSTMLKIGRNEGVLKLYAGLSASILRQATYSTVRFGAYEKLKNGVTAKTNRSKFFIFKPPRPPIRGSNFGISKMTHIM